MNLFSKENDLIKRILNLILIVWLIIAIIIAYNSVVNLWFDYKTYDYSEYKVRFCNEDMTTEECERQYEHNDIYQEDREEREIKTLINSIGNVVIVGTFMIIFNFKKKTTNKN